MPVVMKGFFKQVYILYIKLYILVCSKLCSINLFLYQRCPFYFYSSVFRLVAPGIICIMCIRQEARVHIGE